MRHATRAIATAAILIGVLASGCSTNDAGTIPASGSVGAGCDPGAFSSALGEVLAESLMSVDAIDGFECADGWAVVQATVSGEEVPAVDEQYLFAERDGAWVLRSPEGSCGTIADADGRPGDAAVPESLWELACGDL